MDRPAHSPPTASPSPLDRADQRTRVGNGRAMLLDGTDERTVHVRRLRELCADYARDMGGVDALSSAQRALIRAAANMQIQLEKLDTRFAEDPTVGERTLDLYGRTAGNLRRTLETLGIRRVEAPAKTIAGHLASKRGGT